MCSEAAVAVSVIRLSRMIDPGLGPPVVCSVTKGVTNGRRMLYQPEHTVRSCGVAGVGQPVYPRVSIGRVCALSG